MKAFKHSSLLGFSAIFIILVCHPGHSHAQLLRAGFEASTGYITPDRMPFWLRANQNGDIPPSAASLGLLGKIEKTYNTDDPERLFDWGATLEGRVYTGAETNVVLLQGYAKARLWIFQVKAGRSRDMMGLADSTLSMGAFSVSGTAPGIPKIEAGIPEFFTLPFWGDLFAFKGNFVHGWLGDQDMRRAGNIFPVTTYLHQKSFYGRFGHQDWRLKLYGGFNHQAQWGNEQEYYGNNSYTLTMPESFLYVVIGKAYGTPDIPRSKIGNHLGSIDLGLSYEFDRFRLFAYRQNFYDVGALYYLANIRDGLNGLSLTNTAVANRGFEWHTVVAEFFYSRNQAGELWSPYTPSGDENYYNNFQYVKGWTYKNLNLGNPLIGTRQHIRPDLPNDPENYFINNRVVAFHLGFEGKLHNTWTFITRATYSLNYGTFGTSEAGHSTGSRHTPPRYGIFQETAQFSGFLHVERALGKNMALGLRFALDRGDLYFPSTGV
ncbi:MAG: capsule assembly Wzi family protein [Bacteroidota bacterium]